MTLCVVIARVVVVFSRSVVSNSATPWTAARQASLSFTIPWSSLKLLSIQSVMPSNHLILCCPLLLLPSVFSQHHVFSKAFDCVDHKKLEKSWRDGSTRSPYLPPAKPGCRARSNSWNRIWNNGLVQQPVQMTFLKAEIWGQAC